MTGDEVRALIAQEIKTVTTGLTTELSALLQAEIPKVLAPLVDSAKTEITQKVWGDIQASLSEANPDEPDDEPDEEPAEIEDLDSEGEGSDASVKVETLDDPESEDAGSEDPEPEVPEATTTEITTKEDVMPAELSPAVKAQLKKMERMEKQLTETNKALQEREAQWQAAEAARKREEAQTALLGLVAAKGAMDPSAVMKLIGDRTFVKDQGNWYVEGDDATPMGDVVDQFFGTDTGKLFLPAKGTTNGTGTRETAGTESVNPGKKDMTAVDFAAAFGF